MDPQRLVRELRERSSTASGQLTGAALIAVPALVNPIPLDGAARTVLMVVAVAVGVAGAVMVFGGLFQWVFLPAGPDRDAGTDGDAEAKDDDDAGARPATRDALRAVPHARGVWAGAAVVCAVLAVGAAWTLALAVTDGWDEHLPAMVLLALLAGLLGWAVWAARVMWARDEDPADLA